MTQILSCYLYQMELIHRRLELPSEHVEKVIGKCVFTIQMLS